MRKLFLAAALLLSFYSLGAAGLKTVPGFKVCSIELEGNGKNSVKYRKAGSSVWLNAPELVDVEVPNILRGSLLNLDEDCAYELQVAANGKNYSAEFRTRKYDVPVTETIYLTKKDCFGTFKPKSGTAKGYIRYTAAPGFVYKAGKKSGIGILIENAQYIILDGLVIEGGKFNSVRIRKSKHIRVVNCDISKFGEGGVFRPDLDGKYYNSKNKPIWHNAAINVRDCDDVIIERNYIHDPVTPGNSWFYSHPAGSDGFHIGNTKRVVVRYNDIVGSDKLRWNDAVAGDCDNFSLKGGPSEDAEIYGNYFAFGNDDGIELDGAQKNCRFFFNRIEGFYCGVSIAAVRRGPSYVYCNEMVSPGDEFGLHGVALKTLCGRKVPWSRAFFYRNRAEGNPMGYPRMKGTFDTPRFTCRENVYPAAGNKSMYETFKEKNYTVDINDKLKAPEGVPEYSNELAERTKILRADKNTLRFSHHENMASQQVNIKYNGKSPAEFTVRVCNATDHFTVAPLNGVVKAGETVTLTVTPKKSSSARLNSGALVFRLADGWSAPVSVYVDARKDEVLAKKVLKSLIKGTVTKNGSTHTLAFDLPESGNYILFVRKGTDCANRLEMVLPNQKPVFRRMKLRNKEHKWEVPADAKDSNAPLKLAKGKCEIIIQKSSISSKEPDVTHAYLCSDWHSVLPIVKDLDKLLQLFPER